MRTTRVDGKSIWVLHRMSLIEELDSPVKREFPWNGKEVLWKRLKRELYILIDRRVRAHVAFNTLTRRLSTSGESWAPEVK